MFLLPVYIYNGIRDGNSLYYGVFLSIEAGRLFVWGWIMMPTTLLLRLEHSGRITLLCFTWCEDGWMMSVGGWVC
jgi:hypothetical protein